MVELPEVVIVSLSVSVVTAFIIYLVVRGQVSVLRASLNDQMPQLRNRIDEISRYSEAGRLKDEFQSFGQDIVNRIESLKRLSTEELAKVREDITSLAERRSVDAAIAHVKQVTITKDEFERLREMVVKMGGREETIERMDLLSQIFDSTDIRVLNWQCKLVHLLEGGLSPEAEADIMVSEGIPMGSARDFLKALQKQGIALAKKVESYWLNPDYTWFVTYTRDPDWLKSQLADMVKREREYENYVRDHISLVEEGLIVVTEQFELPTGRVDIFARDKNGKDILVELKYPTATGAVVGQLLKYRENLRLKSGQDPRCVLVAPKISEKVKHLMAQNKMECCEILF